MILLNSEVSGYIYSNKKKYSYFAGNNYLGLAGHPRMKEAVIKAVEKYGVNFAASRHTTGTSDLHLELESALASFKGEEDAVVFASGYQGNSIMLEILKGRYSTVFIDQSAHASIISAIPPEVVKVMYYDHLDADHLNYLLDYNSGSGPLVITDGIFALTGETAPFNRIYEVAQRHKAILVVDDAHATGVLGATGKGTPEHFNLSGVAGVYQTETMSKALGGYGGFISGNREITGLIRSGSVTYQASTALPPPIAAAGIASVAILKENPGLREELLDKAWRIRESVREAGFVTTDFRTPIVPLIFDEAEKAAGLSRYLEENGVIVPFMNYPVRELKHLVRIAVSVTHSEEQIENLIGLLTKWKRRYETN